jgi:hypothetical protein
MKNYAARGKNAPFSSQNSQENIDAGIEELSKKLGITEKELFQRLKTRQKSKIPVSIFSNEKLSGFELVCKYLIENCKLPMPEAARLLSRDYQTIWTEYRNAAEKQPGQLIIPQSRHCFPISILANRRLSVLEAIVVYMKQELGLKFIDIARELHRDARNIWTVYKRANAKK